jgi:hypothetical protein
MILVGILLFTYEPNTHWALATVNMLYDYDDTDMTNMKWIAVRASMNAKRVYYMRPKKYCIKHILFSLDN